MTDRQGIAFIAALAVMVMLTVMGLAFMYMVRMEMIVNRNQFEALQAVCHAESAVEHSIAEIIRGTDADGDGLGNIPPQDLDADGQDDYEAVYAANQITATGTGTSEVNRTVIVDVTTSKWSGAMQFGGQIGATVANGGIINGNIDAVNAANISPSVTVNGTVTGGNSSLSIPTPDMPAFNLAADYHYSGWPTWNGQPPDGDGMYYISGNLTISGVNNFTLNGSIIVTGVLQVSSMTGTMTVAAQGGNPAIVTGASITLTSSQALDFTGLVYSGTNINMSALSGQTTINGGLVAGGNLDAQWVSNWNLTFDPAMDPPNFLGAGGGSPTITLWRGHP